MVWLLCVMVAGALADEPTFVDASEQLRALNYEDALASLDGLLAKDRPDAERATLLVYAGAARTLLGDDAAARLAFENALRLDPSVTVSFKTSPKVTQLFAEVRARVTSAAAKRSDDTGHTEKADSHGAAAADASHGSSSTAQTAQPSNDDATAVPALAPHLPLLPIGTALAGAAALGGAAFFGVQTGNALTAAGNTDTSQRDAVALTADANTQLAIALGLGAAGVVLGGVALGTFVLDP